MHGSALGRISTNLYGDVQNMCIRIPKNPIEGHNVNGWTRISKPSLSRHCFKGWMVQVCVLALVYFPATVFSQVPAFPGAEGSGALAKGGRGGVICEVTNLNDSGPGSLRACAEEMSGPRTVIFRVSGNIVLQDRIYIRNPYITIAGQTAPGGGIQLSAKDPGTLPYDMSGPNAANDSGAMIDIRTHEVIIRYLRIRPGFTGPKAGTSSGQLTGIRLNTIGGNSIYNVMLDHLSIMWWSGNSISLWDNPMSGPAIRFRNISIQNSLMAEALYERFNLLIGSSHREDTPNAGGNMGDIDLHKNFLSTAHARFPLIGSFDGRARLVNNIFYNSYGLLTQVRGYEHPQGPPYVDIIGNWYDVGPVQPKSGSRGLYPVAISRQDDYPPQVYLDGNWSNVHGYDNYNMATWGSRTSSSQRENNPAPDDYRRNAPNPSPPIPIKLVHVDDLAQSVLPYVGASRRLDCEGNWLLNRDAADTRVIEEGYKKRAQTFFVKHEDEVGGFPVLERGEPCADSSGDGIPDAWMIRNDLNPNEAVGRLLHESGYTYLELYMNGMQVNAHPQIAPAAAPGGVTVQ